MRKFHIWIDGECVIGMYGRGILHVRDTFNRSDLAFSFPIGKFFKIVEVRQCR